MGKTGKLLTNNLKKKQVNVISERLHRFLLNFKKHCLGLGMQLSGKGLALGSIPSLKTKKPTKSHYSELQVSD